MEGSLRKWAVLSVLSFLLSSAAVLLMPLASFEREAWRKAVAYILASVFWLGIIAGVLFLRPVSKRRKRDTQYREISGSVLTRFFSNRTAVVIDVMLAVSFIALAAALIIRVMPQWAFSTILSVFVFSFETHWLFNGRNYTYLTQLND